MSMTDRLFATLDRMQALSWRVGIRFQWPCWLIDWAWDQQATPYTRSEPLPGLPPKVTPNG